MLAGGPPSLHTEPAKVRFFSPLQVILNADFMDKKRVDVAVRDQKSVSGRVWARMVHSMPTRETPALDADAEAAARLV